MSAPRIPRARFEVRHSIRQALVEWSARLVAACILTAIAAGVLALVSCGGHTDPADEHRDTGPVNCRAHPEQCR